MGRLAYTDSTHAGLQRPRSWGRDRGDDRHEGDSELQLNSRETSFRILLWRFVISSAVVRHVTCQIFATWVKGRFGGEPLAQEGDTVLLLNIPIGAKIGFSTSIRPVSGFTAGCETVVSHGIPPSFVVEDSSPLSLLALSAERAYTVFVLTARTVNA